MVEIIEALGIDLFNIVLTGLVGYFFWHMKKNDDKKSQAEDKKDKEEKQKQEIEEVQRQAERVGMMLLLRYMLKRYHTEYMWQGYITEEQFVDYKELYEAYHALGGNSVAERWWKDILGLEIKDTETGLSPYAKAYFHSLEKEKNDGI